MISQHSKYLFKLQETFGDEVMSNNHEWGSRGWKLEKGRKGRVMEASRPGDPGHGQGNRCQRTGDTEIGYG
jgi:hypothetical protein